MLVACQLRRRRRRHLYFTVMNFSCCSHDIFHLRNRHNWCCYALLPILAATKKKHVENTLVHTAAAAAASFSSSDYEISRTSRIKKKYQRWPLTCCCCCCCCRCYCYWAATQIEKVLERCHNTETIIELSFITAWSWPLPLDPKWKKNLQNYVSFNNGEMETNDREKKKNHVTKKITSVVWTLNSILNQSIEILMGIDIDRPSTLNQMLTAWYFIFNKTRI